MPKKIVFLACFTIIQLLCHASEADTVLSMVISKPFFYNVAQNVDGVIYAGTSNGIYVLNGEKLSHFGSESGYVKIEKNGNAVIDATGISNYEGTKYLYLLPYPTEKRQEYHSGNEHQFYIVSGGRLFIFDIVPYSISYRNQSIRSISKNAVGGYSGVYFKGVKLNFPALTDGYIREFGDTTFICYGGLFMITPGKSENFLIEAPYGAYIDSVDVGYINDIAYFPKYRKFILSTSYGIYAIGKEMKSPQKIYNIQPGEPVVLLGAREGFLFTVANKLITYSFKDAQLAILDSTTENIISGHKPNNRFFYTLSNHTLYQNTTTGYFNKVANFNDGHTLLSLNEKELIISGNQGLYCFNVETKTTSLIINGVEFNRNALYIENNKLYAGSISGLYTIDVSQIQKLIDLNNLELNASNDFLTYLYWATAMVVIIIFSLLIIFRLRRQLRNSRKKIAEVQLEIDLEKGKKLTKDMIEAFIRQNLSTASIKSINEHFNTNTSLVYILLEPDKPGTIIQKLRLETVIEMKKAGDDIKLISETTGLSESYIKKIKTT